ncbi:hypothetical protein BT93_K1630 [Corymbia citriodora subsp. variegata]|nr:hypothetical protein BT93_K1630 [Corymbia citriodora subsp. variegata]
MASNIALKICFLFFVCLITSRFTSAQLSNQGYYAKKCPKALDTIRSAVKSAVAKEARMGASLLRLHFHDCFVNASFFNFLTLLYAFHFMSIFNRLCMCCMFFYMPGCDASILLDDTANFTGEKTAFPNANSARGFDVIDTIKSKVEKLCPGIVSCADILAVVARDSVVELGGRSWQVQLGRRDSTTASLSAANTNLPAPTLNLSGLITSFSNKGFSTKEMVALSGSHTIGQARCVTFRTRLYNENDISSSFATSLKAKCPSSGGDNNLSPLDVTSPTSFDSGYFSNLVSQKGLLHSDQQLFSGGSTNAQVTAYSKNSGLFQNDFAKAMVKMGGLSPLTGSKGQIRTNCRRVN